MGQKVKSSALIMICCIYEQPKSRAKRKSSRKLPTTTVTKRRCAHELWARSPYLYIKQQQVESSGRKPLHSRAHISGSRNGNGERERERKDERSQQRRRRRGRRSEARSRVQPIAIPPRPAGLFNPVGSPLKQLFSLCTDCLLAR